MLLSLSAMAHSPVFIGGLHFQGSEKLVGINQVSNGLGLLCFCLDYCFFSLFLPLFLKVPNIS
jgi:hypothetical protein